MKSDRKTSYLLVAGFGVMLALMLILEFGAVQLLDAQSKLTRQIYRHPFAVSNTVLHMDVDILAMHRSMQDVALAQTVEQLERAASRVREAEAEVTAHFDIVMERFLGDRARIEAVRKIFDDWQPIRAEVIALARAGRNAEAALITQGKGARQVALLSTQLDGVVEFAENKAAEFLASSDNAQSRSKNILHGLMSAVLVLGVLVAGFVIRQVRAGARRVWRSEELLRRYFDAGLIGMAIRSADQDFLQFNDKFCEMMGYTRAELAAMDWQDITHPDDREIGAIESQQVWAGQRDSYSIDKRYLHKDGHILYAHLSVECVRKTDGAVDYFILFVQDITERKQDEQVLLAHIQQREALADLGQSALEKETLSKLMGNVVDTLARILETDYCGLLELLPGQDGLLLRSGAGWDENQVGSAIIPVGSDSHAGYTLQTNEPVILEDLATETRFSGTQLLREHGVVSGMSVIIQGANGPWGLLGVHSKTRRSFSEDEVEFLQTVANILSVTISSGIVEEKLRRSEEKFRGLMESASDGMLIVDAGGKIEFVNKQLQRMTGYTTDELLGQTADILVPTKFNHHEKLQVDYRANPQIRRMGQGRSLHVRRKDGSEFQAEISLSPLVTEKGMIIAVGVNDITARKQAEAALQRYEHIVNATADLMVFIDTDYIYRAINQSYLDVYQMRLDEVIDHTIAEVLGTDFFEQVAKVHCDRCLSGEEFSMKLWRNYPDKGNCHMDINYSPHRDTDGKITGIVLSLRDITEQKMAEEVLRQSEESYRMLVENSPYCVHQIDLQGELISMNKAGLVMMGVKDEFEILGELYLDVVSDKDKDRITDLLQQAYAGQMTEFEFESISGRVFGSSFVPITDEFGEVSKVMSMTQDITERKQTEQERIKLEAQLFQAQKMEAVGQLTGGIAHDFNNILQSILGYSSLAQDKLKDDQQDSKLAAYLKEITHGGERARDLITQLLTYSRTDERDVGVQSLRPLVEHALKLLRPMLPSSIDIQTRLPDKIPDVRIDPTKFDQILMNLCINARDAIAGSGRIEIELFRSHCDGEVCNSCHETILGQFVTLTVKDSGSGMPDFIKSQVFDPFFTTKEVGRGSGMGLSMVHGILHQCGGHVQISSTHGEGTTFHLMFPVVSDEQTRTAKKIESRQVKQEHEYQRKHNNHAVIMVVDDEASVASYVAELLEVNGYEVIAFSSSEIALATIKQKPESVDLIITDQTMPAMTGLELAHEVKLLCSDIPIILMSGYNEQIDKMSAEKSVVDAFFKKPIDVELLLKEINELLGEKIHSLM